MYNKLLKTFLLLISLFIIIIIYFSTIGIKTSKFSQLIKDKLIKIDTRLSAKLEDVFLVLDLSKREIKVETDNTNLYLNNNQIEISKIKIDIDIFSFIKRKNEVKNIEITTKENSLKNILNFAQSYKPNFSLILLKNIVQQGSVKAKLEFNFNNNDENYTRFFLTGKIVDSQLNLLY